MTIVDYSTRRMLREMRETSHRNTPLLLTTLGDVVSSVRKPRERHEGFWRQKRTPATRRAWPSLQVVRSHTLAHAFRLLQSSKQ
jgi:hypothetical protein